LKRLTQIGAVRKTQVTGSSHGGRECLYETVPAVDGSYAESDRLALN
jgi:predicted transcriptional regulator